MNLNVTLEFACYTQYVEYMYLCIYGKTLGPTITPNVIATLPHFAVELYFTQISKQQQILYYHETQHQNNL